jgi:hypothetical protein
MNITRISNDRNGNSRRVIHFLDLITDADRAERASHKLISTGSLYDFALAKARRIGGKRFHNKQFGGGVVFQSCSDSDLIARIQSIL